MEKVPDRIPVMLFGTFVVAHLYGLTPYEAMYDMEKLVDAHRRFLVDYRPDYSISPAFIGSGTIFETLDYKQYKWPGHGVSRDSGYQYAEEEYMRAEDYLALIDDPTYFWVRRFLPRAFGAGALERDPGLYRPLGNCGRFASYGCLRHPSGAGRVEGAHGCWYRSDGVGAEDRRACGGVEGDGYS